MPKISILYISKGSTCSKTYNSLGIERCELESEYKEPSGIWANYCNEMEVDVHCVYQATQYQQPYTNDQGLTLHFIEGTNLNPVIKSLDTDYICIVEQGYLMTSKDWLLNLLSNYQSFPNAGVIGISTDTTKQKPLFHTNKDFESVISFFPNDGIIEGVCFFSSIVYNHVGILASNLDGWEIPQFCIRAIKTQYTNFYIDNEFAILDTKYPKSAIGRFAMQQSLYEMNAKKSWYLH